MRSAAWRLRVVSAILTPTSRASRVKTSENDSLTIPPGIAIQGHPTLMLPLPSTDFETRQPPGFISIHRWKHGRPVLSSPSCLLMPWPWLGPPQPKSAAKPCRRLADRVVRRFQMPSRAKPYKRQRHNRPVKQIRQGIRLCGCFTGRGEVGGAQPKALNPDRFQSLVASPSPFPAAAEAPGRIGATQGVNSPMS